MAKSSSVRAFLSLVAESKRGFKFGEPERIQEDGMCAVVPILRKTSIRRQYVTFPESPQVVVNDTGRIDHFSAKNPTEHNVFVRCGTIFKGSTQERCLVRSAVLFPGKTADLEVRCIHASRGIQGGASTKYGGVVPFELDQSSYGNGYKPADQHAYWDGVESYVGKTGMASGAAHSDVMSQQWAGQRFTRHPSGLMAPQGILRHMAHDGESDESVASSYSASGALPQPTSPLPRYGGEVKTAGGIRLPSSTSCSSSSSSSSSDLHSTIEAFSTNIDDVLRRVKRLPNQVGLGVITDKCCQTIELFDVQDSWAALHGDAVKRVGQDLSRKNNAFEFNAEFAKQTVMATLADEYQENVILEHRPSNGEPPVRIVGLTSERFLGEVVEIEGRVIHLILNRRAA